MRPPRIALSGSAGTGKTTLGRRLAAELGVPFLEEGMRRRIEDGMDLHSLDFKELEAFCTELWREHRGQVRAAADTGFVVDRSAVDFAAFHVHYGFTHPEAPADRFIEEVLGEVERYDRILVFPWDVLPLEEDGVRTTNRWTQFRFHSILEGFLARWVDPDRVLRIPEVESLESRLETVRGALESGGKPGASAPSGHSPG